jgi:hypothetical protein
VNVDRACTGSIKRSVFQSSISMFRWNKPSVVMGPRGLAVGQRTPISFKAFVISVRAVIASADVDDGDKAAASAAKFGTT